MIELFVLPDTFFFFFVIFNNHSRRATSPCHFFFFFFRTFRARASSPVRFSVTYISGSDLFFLKTGFGKIRALEDICNRGLKKKKSHLLFEYLCGMWGRGFRAIVLVVKEEMLLHRKACHP